MHKYRSDGSIVMHNVFGRCSLAAISAFADHNIRFVNMLVHDALRAHHQTRGCRHMLLWM